MRISWFRPDPRTSDHAVDGVAHLITALAAHHDVHVVDRATAHGELWRYRRGLTDLAVYELTGAAGDGYLWPYLVRLPGLALVLGRQAVSGHRSHLVRQGRRADADAERAFIREAPEGSLALPLACSRLVAVPSGSDAGSQALGTGRVRTFEMAMARPEVVRVPRATALRVGLIAPELTRQALAERASARASAAGAAVELVTGSSAADVLARADVVASLAWPSAGGLTGDVLAAQALGIPAIVIESVETASLPCLDPQTWQSRDRGPGAPLPVAVSLDARDQEHSLMLALRRLATDDGTLAAMGRAAAQRWEAHHQPGHAAETFAPILDAARQTGTPALPPGWPSHFQANASDMARRILAETGLGNLTVDIL